MMMTQPFPSLCCRLILTMFETYPKLVPCRLVDDEERRWTNENVDSVGLKHFPNIDKETALHRPILYSCWLSKDYVPVEQEELRDYVKARLKVRSKFLFIR